MGRRRREAVGRELILDNRELSPVENLVGVFTLTGPAMMRFSVTNALFLNGRKEDADLSLELTTSNTHQRPDREVLVNDSNITSLRAFHDLVRDVYSFPTKQAFILFDAKSAATFAIQSKQHMNCSLTAMRDAAEPPTGESRYEFLVVTFAKTISGRLVQPDHVHDELKAVLQGPGQAPPPVVPVPPAPGATRVANPARVVMREQTGPNRTARLRTFDLDGEVEAVPAVAPTTMMPTSVVLTLPLHPKQTMITVDVANVPALLAINGALTVSTLHLGPPRLTQFTNLDGITDIIHAMRQPANGQDTWTPEQDAALVVACRRRLEAEVPIHWHEIGTEMHREAAACERRWAVLGGMPTPREQGQEPGLVEPLVEPDTATGRRAWSPEDDEQLRAAVADALDWNAIAVRLGWRTGAQVLERWKKLA